MGTDASLFTGIVSPTPRPARRGAFAAFVESESPPVQLRALSAAAGSAIATAESMGTATAAAVVKMQASSSSSMGQPPRLHRAEQPAVDVGVTTSTAASASTTAPPASPQSQSPLLLLPPTPALPLPAAVPQSLQSRDDQSAAAESSEIVVIERRRRFDSEQPTAVAAVVETQSATAAQSAQLTLTQTFAAQSAAAQPAAAVEAATAVAAPSAQSSRMKRPSPPLRVNHLSSSTFDAPQHPTSTSVVPADVSVAVAAQRGAAFRLSQRGGYRVLPGDSMTAMQRMAVLRSLAAEMIFHGEDVGTVSSSGGSAVGVDQHHGPGLAGELAAALRFVATDARRALEVQAATVHADGAGDRHPPQRQPVAARRIRVVTRATDANFGTTSAEGEVLVAVHAAAALPEASAAPRAARSRSRGSSQMGAAPTQPARRVRPHSSTCAVCRAGDGDQRDASGAAGAECNVCNRSTVSFADAAQWHKVLRTDDAYAGEGSTGSAAAVGTIDEIELQRDSSNFLSRPRRHRHRSVGGATMSLSARRLTGGSAVDSVMAERTGVGNLAYAPRRPTHEQAWKKY